MRSGGMCGAAASRRPGSSYRSELVRRGCADRNPSRPPRWIAASLRHCAPRYGVSASPWSRPPCDGAPTSLWSCASATAYRHRSGAASPATAFRPRSGGHDLCPDAALRRCTPTGDHDSRPGDHDSRPGATTLALASRPRFWVVFLPRCRDPRCPGGHDPRLGGARCENRRFWSLAVKTDGFSRSRKWEMDDFAGCSRRGFPLAQIIACFGLEAAKNRQF